MNLARVEGVVVATVKDPKLRGQRLLLLQPLSRTGKPNGPRIVATDTVKSGVRDLVIYVRGKEAAFAHRPADVVTDACITGHVERHHLLKASDFQSSPAIERTKLSAATGRRHEVPPLKGSA